MTPFVQLTGPGASICAHRRESEHAHRAAVLPQQAPLRRPGCLRPSPQPRAGRTRPRGRGVLRASPTPSSTRACALTQGAEPGPLPRARPVPDPAAQRVPRPHRLLEVPDDVHGRVPRAEDVQHCAPRACCATAVDDFDVVHDNQMPRLRAARRSRRSGLPVVTTMHHPITFDRRIDLAAAPWWRKPLVRRWYGFAGCRSEVARQIPELLTVSTTSAADIAEDFGVDPTSCRSSRSASTTCSCRRRSRGCPAASSRWPAPTRR